MIRKALSRRGFLAAAPIAAAAAPVAAQQAFQKPAWPSGVGFEAYPPSSLSGSTMAPRMARDAALAIARKDPTLAKQVEDWVSSALVLQSSDSLDPDIARRCWSQAAKIFAQRERDRERQLKQMWSAFDGNGLGENPIWTYINKLMYG